MAFTDSANLRTLDLHNHRYAMNQNNCKIPVGRPWIGFGGSGPKSRATRPYQLYQWYSYLTTRIISKNTFKNIIYSLTWSPWILSTGTCSKHSIFTYLVSMNFIHRHLLQTFYIHLPGLHEFYPGTPPQCSQIWFWIFFLCTMYAWGLCPFLGMEIYCEKNLAPRIFSGINLGTTAP